MQWQMYVTRTVAGPTAQHDTHQDFSGAIHQQATSGGILYIFIEDDFEEPFQTMWVVIFL